MSRQWYEPQNFSEYLKRVFSFLNLALFIFTAVFIFSELRFNWIENLVGSYLASTNDIRPKTGVIWETGKHTSQAYEYIDEIVSKQENTRQSLNQATSFPGLAARILPGDWVTFDKEQFKKLYLELDQTIALKIIEPARLVWLLKGDLVDRIFCEGVPGGIKIYFIDSQNRVIQQIPLKKEDLVEIENGDKAVTGTLTEMEGFSGRIYTAREFFDNVFRLAPDILPDLMVDPEKLLNQEGNIVRVGIWNISQNGYIQLGFEFEFQGTSRVVFIKGREWAVWQLNLYLKGGNG